MPIFWLTWDEDGTAFIWVEKPTYSGGNDSGGWLADKPGKRHAGVDFYEVPILDGLNSGEGAIQSLDIEVQGYEEFERFIGDDRDEQRDG